MPQSLSSFWESFSPLPGAADEAVHTPDFPEKGKFFAVLQVVRNPVIERFGQSSQIPVSHVAVKRTRLGSPGFFQYRKNVAEGRQTGSPVLPEGGQLEFGGVGNPLGHMEQAGNLLISIRTELGILWAALFFRNFHQVDQRRLQFCGTLKDPALPKPLGILPLFLLGVEGGQLFLFIDAGGWDGIDKLFRPGEILPVAVIGDAHGQGGIPDFRCLAVGHTLIKGNQPVGIGVRVWNTVEEPGAVQIENCRINQLFAGGVLMDLVHGPLERGVIALLRDHAVQFFQKMGNLLVAQLLLKGQQGVEVGPQHPGRAGRVVMSG
ncbi:MAG: hypothetical protein V8S86_05490 [Eubacteriales bacterium]